MAYLSVSFSFAFGLLCFMAALALRCLIELPGPLGLGCVLLLASTGLCCLMYVDESNFPHGWLGMAGRFLWLITEQGFSSPGSVLVVLMNFAAAALIAKGLWDGPVEAPAADVGDEAWLTAATP